jgi:hypothetical protein
MVSVSLGTLPFLPDQARYAAHSKTVRATLSQQTVVLLCRDFGWFFLFVERKVLA